MWYKNKKSGLIWEIVDKELILRLNQDVDYEVVNEVVEETNPVDHADFTYNELRSLAKDKGINTHKMSKEDLQEALNKVGE